jgi:outer membrane immunogenic protein
MAMYQQLQRPSGEISMIRLMLASTAIAALLAGGPALAADQKVKAPLYTKAPIIPVFSWTGFYLGANAGGHWGRDNISTTTSANFDLASRTAIDLASPNTLKPEGWLAGVQVGYNMEVNHVVLGLEGDADWLNGTSSRSLVFPGPSPTAGDTLSNSTQGTFLATLRPRLGFAYDRTLFYVTGGLAVGTVKTTDSMTVGGGAVLESTSDTKTRTGWTAGGGFEYAFTDNWSAKVEVLHVDLGGTYDAGIPCVVGCGAAATDIVVHHKYTDNIARFGINYRLGAPASVVANY